MARIARVIVPGCPHHVIHRGNRRQTTLFGDDDYQAYVDLTGEWCRRRRPTASLRDFVTS
jgi:putative transposase